MDFKEANTLKRLFEKYSHTSKPVYKIYMSQLPLKYHYKKDDLLKFLNESEEELIFDIEENQSEKLIKTSEYTKYKQRDLRNIIDSIFPIAKGVLYKHTYYTKYYVFDLTSGDANKEGDTSPNIFIETLNKYKIPSTLYLFEEKKKIFSLLLENLKDNGSPYTKVYAQRKWSLILTNQQIKNKLGLVYFDPYGCGNPTEWKSIQALLSRNNQLDLLFNINSTKMKAFHNCSKTSHVFGDTTLSSFVKLFNKKFKYIRGPYPNTLIGKSSGHRFIMLFMTNLSKYTPPIGFVDIDSKEGKDIIWYCETTEKEKDKSKGSIKWI